MRPSKVQIPSEVVDVLTVKMSSCNVDHRKYGHRQLSRLRREHEEHDVSYQRRDQLMNPLNSNGELEEEGSEDEREEMFHFSVGEGEHYHAEGVADEHSEEILQGLHILSS